MIKKKLKDIFLFFLNDFSDKFDAHALKSFVDQLFILSEKIIIHFPLFLSYYISYYDDIIHKEIILAHINENSSVLHVGCGSIPATTILLAQKTHANIIGTDRDIKAIYQARKIIDNYQLSQYIKIKNENVFNIDLHSFDIILLSQGIQPKQKFIQDLSKQISADHRVILRSFSQGKHLNTSDKFLTEYYTILDIFHHIKHGSTISIIMKKK